MSSWHIQYSPEVAAQLEEKFGEDWDPEETGIYPNCENVVADEIRVEGGAVLFMTGGQVHHVFGPAAYRSVFRFDDDDE
jgi:hypothetical protein